MRHNNKIFQIRHRLHGVSAFQRLALAFLLQEKIVRSSLRGFVAVVSLKKKKKVGSPNGLANGPSLVWPLNRKLLIGYFQDCHGESAASLLQC